MPARSSASRKCWFRCVESPGWRTLNAIGLFGLGHGLKRSNVCSLDITRTGGLGGAETRPPANKSRALSNLPTRAWKQGRVGTDGLLRALACASADLFPEVSPRNFSFNNPYGACPECGGIGTRWETDPDGWCRTRPRCRPGRWRRAGRESTYFRQTLAALAKRYKFSLTSRGRSCARARGRDSLRRQGRRLRGAW